MISSTTAIELAYGKGMHKKWSLEAVLMDCLYETKSDSVCYLMLKDVDGKNYDSESETEYVVRFGYLFRFPTTEIDLHINKKSHRLYATKEGIGFGYDEVEKEVVKYLMAHKRNKNLKYQSSLNAEVFDIK